MAEVLFYHLTRTPLEVTLPELLEKSLMRHWRIVVQSHDKERLNWLDDRLWNYRADSFLPHGMMGADQAENQPILLSTTVTAKNDAQVIMVIDGTEISETDVRKFERCCILFDGNDLDALEVARGQWKRLTDAGIPAHYWSQENGAWQKKLSKNL